MSRTTVKVVAETTYCRELVVKGIDERRMATFPGKSITIHTDRQKIL